MTRTTNARIAGFAYVAYTAAGISHEILMHRATNAEGDVAKLAHIAEHATDVRIAILFTLVECFSALVLAVALYGITRDEDNELALLGMVCRVAEGVLVSLGIPSNSQLLWLAKAGPGAGASDVTTTNALRAFLLMPGAGVPLGAVFFAVGSTLFSYLLLRGRIVPAPLAWLGVFASGMLLVSLPLQLAGFSTGPLTGYYQWLPALIFQIMLAPWLLIKGADTPAAR